MQYCFFTAWDVTSITSHIHSWTLLLFWLCLFILSGVISPVFSGSVLDTYQPGEFIFQRHIFLPFHTVQLWQTMTNLDRILNSVTLPTKVRLVKAMVFPVVMYGCESDHKESWAQKNWCFWTVVLDKTLESSLDCKEIQPVHPKGNQFWVFIGRTDVEAETPVFWPPDAKN